MHESEWLTGGSWRGLRAAIAAWAIVRLIESGISKVVADLNGARTTLVIVEWALRSWGSLWTERRVLRTLKAN
jgi:hypothetical protein